MLEVILPVYHGDNRYLPAMEFPEEMGQQDNGFTGEAT